MGTTRIAIIGDYDPGVVAHQAVPRALEIAGQALHRTVQIQWVPTLGLARNGETVLDDYDGVWCVPGSPYRSMEGAIAAIRHARESGIVFLGTCGGFQHAVIEFARNVLKLSDADHAESNPGARSAVITPLSCSLVEVAGTIRFVKGSLLREIYGRDDANEQYHCNYGLNAKYREKLEAAGMKIVGHALDGDIRALELTGHPFYIATLFQPERSALQGDEHPLIKSFVRAAAAD